MTKRDKLPSKGHSATGILMFGVLAVGLVIGFNTGIQGTHDPAVPPVTATSNNHNSTAPPPKPPTATNTTIPTGPPPTAPDTTLVYGMVNVGYVLNITSMNLPGWVLTFRYDGMDYNASLVLQWNQWRTNYWFDYSIVLRSNIGYAVMVSQGNKYWNTLQGSITPSGQNSNQNFVTTGQAS